MGIRDCCSVFCGIDGLKSCNKKFCCTSLNVPKVFGTLRWTSDRITSEQPINQPTPDSGEGNPGKRKSSSESDGPNPKTTKVKEGPVKPSKPVQCSLELSEPPPDIPIADLLKKILDPLHTTDGIAATSQNDFTPHPLVLDPQYSRETSVESDRTPADIQGDQYPELDALIARRHKEASARISSPHISQNFSPDQLWERNPRSSTLKPQRHNFGRPQMNPQD